MTKILFLINNLNIGGAESYILNLADNISENDYKISILLLNAGNKAQIEHDGQNLHFLDKFITKIYQIWRILKAIKEINRINAEIVHSNLMLSDWIVGFYKLLNRNKIAISTHHGFNFERFHSIKIQHKIHLKIQSYFYRKFDKIVCVSNELKKYAVKTYNLHEDRIEIIYNGIEKPEDYPVFNINKQFSGKLLFIGRLVPVKNIPFLLNLIEHLSSEYTLTIVGDGSERTELEADIKSRGLKNRVELCGFRTNVETIILSHDILIIPSFFESFSITALQGFVIGIPTLVSKHTGIVEIIPKDLTRLLIDPDDLNSCIKIINDVIKNYNKTIRQIIEYRDHFCKYSLKNSCINYQNLYKKLFTAGV